LSSIEKAIERLGEAAKIGGRGQQSPKELEPKAGEALSGDSEVTSAISSGAGGVVAIREILSSNDMINPDDPHSPIAEQFRRIKRPLLMNAQGGKTFGDGHSNLVLVTSSVAGEGKTFNSINLAISMAMELDRTVLLIDADVRRPGCSELLGLKGLRGLTDILTDDGLSIADVLVKTDVEKFNILPVGTRKTYTTELLASGNMKELVEEVSRRYSDRMIILDSPPLLETSEAGVLTHLVGQVVVVVEAESTTKAQLKEALSNIDEGKYVGMVLNKAKKHLHSYGYDGMYSTYEYK